MALRGKAAVAQAQVAYDIFVATFGGPRWETLAARGARVQRPLWASTSTKNPEYPDTLYVDLHLLHEVTTPQAFEILRSRGLKVRRPDRCRG